MAGDGSQIDPNLAGWVEKAIGATDASRIATKDSDAIRRAICRTLVNAFGKSENKPTSSEQVQRIIEALVKNLPADKTLADLNLKELSEALGAAHAFSNVVDGIREEFQTIINELMQESAKSPGEISPARLKEIAEKLTITQDAMGELMAKSLASIGTLLGKLSRTTELAQKALEACQEATTGMKTQQTTIHALQGAKETMQGTIDAKERNIDALERMITIYEGELGIFGKSSKKMGIQANSTVMGAAHPNTTPAKLTGQDGLNTGRSDMER